MTIPKNITKEHLLNAITKIDQEGVQKYENSQYYDVIYNGKKYPPKLIVSYANIFANGNSLDRSTFSGGLGTQSFELLEKNGFVIEKKTDQEIQPGNFWIEKTIVNGRADRESGERALGVALWSPKQALGGADIYKNMRLVKRGDIVLHLINNQKVSGVSIVEEAAIDTTGLEGTPWNTPSYLVKLEQYTPLNPDIDRSQILTAGNKELLNKIAKHSEVFYTNKLDLRQGAYLTPCPIELLTLINTIYRTMSSNNLPFIDTMDNEPNANKSKDPFEINELADILPKSGIQIQDKLILRFAASLLTKPFVILTGLSGSGKTKLAQAFSLWICENENQYRIVPVGADWTNREPLLGFPNALEEGKYVKPDNKVLDLIISANENPNKPYFLILDEMNLSHVERYFADFLSVMESKGEISLHAGSSDWEGVPSNIGFPGNLFIIGTVNIDETTYMFSPKVLDRANVIEFIVTHDEMNNYLSNFSSIDMETLKSKGAHMANSFLEIALNKSLQTNNKNELQTALMNFFSELKKTGAEFGYRSAAEILRFAAVINKIAPTWIVTDIIDAAIMQKLLPKVHGARRKLEPVLKTLGTLCLTNGQKIDDFISPTTEIDFADPLKIKYPISFEKILRMYHGLIDNGFTSYAEA